jgi:hypothetical protein
MPRRRIKVRRPRGRLAIEVRWVGIRCGRDSVVANSALFKRDSLSLPLAVMSETTVPRIRLQITDLTPRTGRSTDDDLADALKRLGGREGVPCDRDCDCLIGLVCRKGVCTADW